MQTKQHGFSLVELLVVVAIISTLAALLLPALEKSLQEARGIQCLNNQRQLCGGISLYANDGGDILPLSVTHGGWIWNRYGMSTGCVTNISSIVSLDSNAPLNLAVLYSQKYLVSIGVFYCPSGIESSFATTPNWPGRSPTTFSSKYSYIYNVYGMCGIYSWTASGTPASFRQTYWKASSFPSNKIMTLCDGIDFWNTPPHGASFAKVYGSGNAQIKPNPATTAILASQTPNWRQGAFQRLDRYP